MSVRIKDLPLLDLDDIYGYLKIPTGGDGNFAITLDNIRDWVATKHGFALQEDLDKHIEDYNNPHEVTKQQIGLGNVDNTSDLDKPISNAQSIYNEGLIEAIDEEITIVIEAIDEEITIVKDEVNAISQSYASSVNNMSGDVLLPEFNGQVSGFVPITGGGNNARMFLNARGNWSKPVDTTYQVIDEEEMLESTSTTPRLVNSVILKSSIQHYSKNISGLQEFETNEDSISGGLLDGDLYRTSTGQLMVTFI